MCTKSLRQNVGKEGDPRAKNDPSTGLATSLVPSPACHYQSSTPSEFGEEPLITTRLLNSQEISFYGVHIHTVWKFLGSLHTERHHGDAQGSLLWTRSASAGLSILLPYRPLLTFCRCENAINSSGQTLDSSIVTLQISRLSKTKPGS